jgi:hypothetical protein
VEAHSLRRDLQKAAKEGRFTMPKQRKTGKKRLTHVRIEAEERDEIDWDRFAWALLQYARVLVENEKTTERSKS